MGGPLQELLCALDICEEGSVKLLFPRVRDRKDVQVFKCQKSGVIFLSRTDHLQKTHYEGCTDFKYWGEGDRKAALVSTEVDDQRRGRQFREMIAGKVWMDVGTGLGGILDILAPHAKKTIAVEPQAGSRESLQKLGYQVYRDLGEVVERGIDAVTLFHVLEHFTDPLEALRRIRSVMRLGGKIVVEVPHANDALLATFDNEAFKAFTFWSEHLILHTRRSLTVFLEQAGFRGVTVFGFQRYPLANHLYWLAKGKPGGHEAWKDFRTEALDKAYVDFLQTIGQTDTLIAVAQA